MRELDPLGANTLYLKYSILTPRQAAYLWIRLTTVTAVEHWRLGTNWSAMMDQAYPAANSRLFHGRLRAAIRAFRQARTYLLSTIEVENRRIDS